MQKANLVVETIIFWFGYVLNRSFFEAHELVFRSANVSANNAFCVKQTKNHYINLNQVVIQTNVSVQLDR